LITSAKAIQQQTEFTLMLQDGEVAALPKGGNGKQPATRPAKGSGQSELF
jgi:hypothetical protein